MKAMNFAILPELVEIWEPKKEYIEKDLWVIRNFLTKEEIDWLVLEYKNPVGWYDTMRSPYGGNIKNKFLGMVPQYTEDGVLIPPHPNYNSKFEPVPFLRDLHGIENRIAAVVPKYFAGAGAFQSIFEVPEEQIIKELGQSVDYAMEWHYERDDNEQAGTGDFREKRMTASFIIYINTDFDGGILEFKYKDYVIKPEVGMIVNVPLYKEFTHRVTKVTNGNRHTLYGSSWNNDMPHLSSIEDC
jgi:hypothetical protein